MEMTNHWWKIWSECWKCIGKWIINSPDVWTFTRVWKKKRKMRSLYKWCYRPRRTEISQEICLCFMRLCFLFLWNCCYSSRWCASDVEISLLHICYLKILWSPGAGMIFTPVMGDWVGVQLGLSIISLWYWHNTTWWNYVYMWVLKMAQQNSVGRPEFGISNIKCLVFWPLLKCYFIIFYNV